MTSHENLTTGPLQNMVLHNELVMKIKIQTEFNTVHHDNTKSINQQKVIHSVKASNNNK